MDAAVGLVEVDLQFFLDLLHAALGVLQRLVDVEDLGGVHAEAIRELDGGLLVVLGLVAATIGGIGLVAGPAESFTVPDPPVNVAVDWEVLPAVVARRCR